MHAIPGLVRAGQLPICINVALDAKKASGGVQKVASEQELGMHVVILLIFGTSHDFTTHKRPNIFIDP